ncbi:MAG: thioredoxin family protein [Elusimicrobia bacterium]|nr:thioredoxin family protein [Elusimicrobiota bacterium]
MTTKKIFISGALLVIFAFNAFAMDTITSLDTLQSKANQNKVIVAVFSAAWCAPCKTFKENIFTPMENSYKEKYGNRVEFYVFDVTETAVAKSVQTRLGINTIPAVIVFSGSMDNRDIFVPPSGQLIRDAIDKRLK